jgi:hypothetical protein
MYTRGGNTLEQYDQWSFAWIPYWWLLKLLLVEILEVLEIVDA